MENANLIELNAELHQRAIGENRKTTNRYRSIDTETLISGVSKVLTHAGISANCNLAASRGAKGTRHIVSFVLDNVVNFLGDQIKPRIVVLNSYNGESSLQVRVGMFRLVCSNGLIVGANYFSERIVHVRGQTAEDKLRLLGDKILAAVNYIQNDLQAIGPVLNTKLTVESEVSIVRHLGLAKRHTEKLTERLQSAYRIRLFRAEDNTGTVWGLYNIVNETIRGRTAYTSDLKNTSLMHDIIQLAGEVA